MGITKEPLVVDLHERASAMCNSMEALNTEFGHNLLDTLAGDSGEREARQTAATLAAAYAADPEKTSKAVTTQRAARLTPQSLQAIRTYLDEFGQSVVRSSVEIRHMVTNRLIEESNNPDPRVRIRALELLGKISDVGLFTERSEVLVTHQSTDELKQKLREKLHRLRSAPVEDATIIDVKAELGLSAP